ncbi:DUF3987 domain-containing protein [Paraburkholderia xenovorans]|uniref:DUF3987 domain-containing protein n=1 Tax=Paraburkholderia xenovorans TaxID=36873 RepID=UPI0038BA94F0
MRSLYDPLHSVVGIPSKVVGPIVLHAGIAYANPVASMASPNGRIGVFGINTMVSGVSGCGKSEVKNYAFGPMFQFQRDQLTRSADGRPRIQTHVLNNATMPAIIKAMTEYSIGNEIDDEFTSSRTGSMTQHASVRNQLYDGHTFTVDRATSGRFILHDPRFTSMVLTQPHVRIAFDEKYGIRLRTTGLATRTQFSEYDGAPVSLNQVEIDTAMWDTNCRRLQDLWIDIMGERMRRGLKKYRPDAIRLLKEIRDNYQQRGQQDGDLAMLPEHAARQPENIQRFAAGIEVFEGLTGDISAETVERAATIGFWFTEQYKLRFLPKQETPQVPREHQEAMYLEQVLHEAARRTGEGMVKLKDLLSFAPNFGMTKAAVQRALIVLCSNDRTRIVKSQGKPDWVALNPMFFPVFRWPGN